MLQVDLTFCTFANSLLKALPRITKRKENYGFPYLIFLMLAPVKNSTFLFFFFSDK